MRVLFIIPSYNAEKNLDDLFNSLQCQSDDRWFAIFIDDISCDGTWRKILDLQDKDNRVHGIKNKSKKFALKNIIETSRLFQTREDVIIAVIDGDDSLCNEKTVEILITEYMRGNDCVWTAHKWDVNGMNISRSIPRNVDPYAWPWSSSHLRTFKASILSTISDSNFKDTSGRWFKRGYDQALMLPVLYKSQKRLYVNHVCYLYNINSVSMQTRNWAEKDQISTINLVRSRGFLEK